jgi:hypothetical protein
MENSKPISGLRFGGSFSLEERHLIIEDYLTSGSTKTLIWGKYSGDGMESGRILRWMRQMGYVKKKIKFRASIPTNMSNLESESIENLQLKEKIAELEKALINSELRSTAYKTAIEIADKELKISILKKFNTKLSIK